MRFEIGVITGVCICLSEDKTKTLPHIQITAENGDNLLLPCIPMGTTEETPDLVLMQYFDVYTTVELVGVQILFEREAKDSRLITTLALPKKSAVFHA